MHQPRHRWTRCGLGLALGLLLTARAEAHLISTGMGPFYDGIGHFFLSPDDILPVIALALIAGMRGPQMRGWVLWALPVAWFAGGWAAVIRGVPPVPEQLSASLSLLVLGILVAADLKIPPLAIVALAAILGGVHGFINGSSMSAAGINPAILQLFGVGLVVFLILLHLTELVGSLKRSWARIVVRVAGSWIAAIGLLLLGWTFRVHR